MVKGAPLSAYLAMNELAYTERAVSAGHSGRQVVDTALLTFADSEMKAEEYQVTGHREPLRSGTVSSL